MDLYNALKSDIIALWDKIGLPVIVVYGVVILIALIAFVFTFVTILRTHSRMSKRINRFR